MPFSARASTVWIFSVSSTILGVICASSNISSAIVRTRFPLLIRRNGQSARSFKSVCSESCCFISLSGRERMLQHNVRTASRISSSQIGTVSTFSTLKGSMSMIRSMLPCRRSSPARRNCPPPALGRCLDTVP